MIALIIMACVLVALIVAVSNIVTDKNRNEVKRLNADLAAERQQRVDSERTLRAAEIGLRSIANGAGNPVLEAQISLDEIVKFHETKEITR